MTVSVSFAGDVADPGLDCARPRQAEIQNLRPARPGDHDVLRLEVAVDDARLVCRGQAVGDLVTRSSRRFMGTGPLRSCSRSVPPSMTSDTMNGVSPSIAASKTVRMLG